MGGLQHLKTLRIYSSEQHIYHALATSSLVAFQLCIISKIFYKHTFSGGSSAKILRVPKFWLNYFSDHIFCLKILSCSSNFLKSQFDPEV